jgi:hypothetical protein
MERPDKNAYGSPKEYVEALNNYIDELEISLAQTAVWANELRDASNDIVKTILKMDPKIPLSELQTVMRIHILNENMNFN